MATREEILAELNGRNIDTDTIVKNASEMYNIDPSIIHAMIKQESNYDQKAVSKKGAMGLMQIMPDTAKELNINDPMNPIENIMGGVKYLADLKNEFGDIKLALAAYNAGRGNVNKYDGIPPFKETQDYVDKILSNVKPQKVSLKSNVSKRNIYDELKRRGMSDEEIFDTMLKANPIEEKSDFWENVLTEIPEFGGAIIGALAGSPSGPWGMIAGAIIGGAAGEATEQLGKHIFYPESAPKTSAEAAREIGYAGLRQGAYEAGGQVVTRAAGKMLAPFARTVLPDAQIAKQTLDKYMPVDKKWFGLVKRKSPTLLPHEVTENRTLDILYNITEGSLIGGKNISKFKVNRINAITGMMDDLVDQFGRKAEPDAVGEAFVLAVENRLETQKLISKPLYETVENMAGNIPVNMSSLKSYLSPLADISKEIGGIESHNAGDDLVKAVLELKDNISFQAAKDLRSRLISKVDEFSITNKKAPAIGKAKALISKLDSAIESSLSRYNPEALKIWREANSIYRSGSEKYNNQFIRRLIKKADPDLGGEPESIVKAIFKPGSISNIRRVKTAVDPETFRQMQSWYMQDVIRKSVSEKGILSGSKFYEKLFGKTGMGEQTLKEMFNPEQLKNIRNIAKTLKIVTDKQAEGTGKMFIQLSQAGAAVGMITGKFKAASLFLLGSPGVLSRIMLSPRGNKLLTTGFKLPPGSPQFMTTMARITGLSATVKKQLDNEKRIKQQKRLEELQVSTLQGGVR